MNIVVLGCEGMLGRYVYRYLYQKFERDFECNDHHNKIIGWGRDKFDVMKHDIIYLEECMTDEHIKNGDIVINCIGIIPHSSNGYKLDDRMYLKVNSIFPHELDMLCSKKDLRFIHITTDCVFTGNKGMYDENDEHDAIDIYGLSKSLGEPSTTCVIRTSIIGEEIKNKKSLFEWVKSNANGYIKGYEHHKWNGVTCLQLAKIIEQIIIMDIFWKGVRHIYSPDSVSKYELLCIINEVYNFNINIEQFSSDLIVDKTLTSIYLENYLFEIPSLKKQIEDMSCYHLF